MEPKIHKSDSHFTIKFTIDQKTTHLLCRSAGLAMVNSLACTFSLLVDDGVVGVVAPVVAVVATPSVRTPGGQRWSSREEMIGKVRMDISDNEVIKEREQ